MLTGRENLVMFGRLYHLPARAARRRADELLERFDLTDAARPAVKTYSGGMRRRLDLAASLIVAPPVLFLDEPTTGLDPRSRLAMWERIGDWSPEGTTVLLTTQYLDEADRLADQIVVLDHGRVAAAGTPRRAEGADRRRAGQDVVACRRRPDGSTVRRAGGECSGGVTASPGASGHGESAAITAPAAVDLGTAGALDAACST